MRVSVSTRFLVSLGLTSLAFTAVSSLAAFAVFKTELEQRQIQFLSHYVHERSSNVGRRFSNLMTLQQSAVSALALNLQHIDLPRAQALLDAETELKPDGTRRSRDRTWDGYTEQDGGRVYGVGAFIGAAKDLPPDQTRLLAAAFPIVARFGMAQHGDYDNFYFFSAQSTRMIVFGPDRPDHLTFYRKTAPGALDTSHEEMSRLVAPAADPDQVTRCTALQRLIQDKASTQRIATACITPAYIDGRYVGAFGSSIKLDSFLNGAVGSGLAGAEALIVRDDGQLIAAPGAHLSSAGAEAAMAAYQKKLGLAALAKRLRQDGRDVGVVRSLDGRDIVAFGRLKGPNWYLLIVYPQAAAALSAAKSASWVLLLGVLGAALQTVMLVRLARSAIVQPLKTLARSCQSADPAALADLASRTDEIGLLARSLAAERARADELLSSLEARVRERTAELEYANDEKSRFLANMSHELRTPLNGVIALSETLLREQTTPRNVELGELIVASGRLLEQVLTDILDFSKIEAGEMRIEHQPFDLLTVVSRVAELHRASAAAKGIELVWSLDEAADGGYRGDPVRITQVLSNLLSNAVKFTETGQVRLCVKAGGQGGVDFEVSDTGIGFDEAVRRRLFQRFEQADVSIRRRFGGTGLGLAICRSFVELMGGSIEARSTPGVGSTFAFHLPLQALEPGQAAAAAAVEPEALDLQGLKVLVAEDHPTNQKVVQLILDTVGIDLTIVDNGRLALEALRAGRFDVVLMDMQMPELDGLSATRALRELELAEGRPRTPVFMLTANALDEHVRASVAAGADRHISKPVRAAELLESIAAAAAAAAAARPAPPVRPAALV